MARDHHIVSTVFIAANETDLLSQLGIGRITFCRSEQFANALWFSTQYLRANKVVIAYQGDVALWPQLDIGVNTLKVSWIDRRHHHTHQFAIFVQQFA